MMLMMSVLTSYAIKLFLIIVVLGYILIKYLRRNYNYWKIKNVPYIEPIAPFGNFFDVFLFRESIGHLLGKFYNQFSAPYFGIYVLDKPHLVLRDPEVIKAVLVKDFNYFYNRNSIADESCDSISSKMLFFSKNPEWRYLRTKMTSVFTTGKMKNMFALISNVSNEMVDYLQKNVDKSVEVKEICAKYATDVITSCAFGLDAQSFQKEDAKFRSVGRKIFDFRYITAIRQTCYFMAPMLVKLFKIPFIDPNTTSFLRNVFHETIREREKTKLIRHDLIDIINYIKSQNFAHEIIKFEGDALVAQAAQFFLAGFETVSATISFALYELCIQPQLQTNLRNEIKEILSNYGNNINYEAIQDMKYLQMVISETLRKYPALPFLDRTSIQDYKIPNTNFVIEKGTPVFIPLFGLHYDTTYFPEPAKFDPERFSDERKNKIPNYTYLPFGDGPRNCIGERFGLLATKMALVYVLMNFCLERNSKTPIPMQFSKRSLLLASKVGIPITFRKIMSTAA